MTCKHSPETLSRYAQGDLPPEERESIRCHLGDCSACRRTLDALERVEKHLMTLAMNPVPLDVLYRCRQALSGKFSSPDPEILTLEDVAALFRLAPGELDEVLGDLPFFEVAGKLRIRRSRLADWIEKQERRHGHRDAAFQVARSLHARIHGGIA